VIELIEVVDLKQAKPGFDLFFSSWIIKSEGKIIVVDPGPSSSINLLINKLNELSIYKIDYLLLTHIHLDHAGGAGLLASLFKVGEIYVHSLGVKHLKDPEKLWQASKGTLGEIATMQQKPLPVPGHLLRSVELTNFNSLTKLIELGNNQFIQVIPTPGHAPHHLSFLMGDYLFIGEALGVVLAAECFNTNSGLERKCLENYLRPATPPKFNRKDYLSSIDNLKNIDCDYLCFGHYGIRKREDSYFERSINQLKQWVKIVDHFKSNLSSPKVLSDESLEYLMQLIITFDNNIKLLESIGKDYFLREAIFIRNTIKGIFFS
jgi:glyoxylase-like metal-dependent hydrolase (beta-lactamase superfamily II)